MSAETPAFVAVSTGPRLDRIAAAVGQRIAGLLPLIALVVAWEGLARAHILSTFLLPTPSSVLDRSFVTYSNDAKREMLDVPADIIDTFGAVSVACVYAMAQGALKESNADVAVAISGIAGPEGGSANKPVGTVVFARVVRGVEEPEAELRNFDEPNRAGVRRQATLCALELLLP